MGDFFLIGISALSSFRYFGTVVRNDILACVKLAAVILKGLLLVTWPSLEYLQKKMPFRQKSSCSLL